MDQLNESSGATPAWLGQESTDSLGEGGIWVAQHAGDDDLLVFEISETAPRPKAQIHV